MALFHGGLLAPPYHGMIVFEAQPVTGKRITVLNLQLDGDDKMSLIIAGHTWPFRARLDSAGISGGYVGDEADKENGTRKYFRVWKDIDVSDENQQQKFLTMLNDVFNNLVMRVCLDRRPSRDTHVGAFVERLRQQPALFFTAESETAGASDDEEETQRLA